jgi:serine/threonine protein kinase
VKRLIKPATNENSIKLVSSFIEEATTMQIMRHERIVEFIFLELETFSMVLEFMPEGTLFSYIKKHRNPPCAWSVRHQLLADVCEGMEFLHSSLYPKREGEDQEKKKEVFHQDLKTQNIMLKRGPDKKLGAKITDFGFSRILSLLLIQLAGIRDMTENSHSAVSHRGGTRYYMAPELAKKGRHKFTKRADLFAAGIVFLEVITLKGPKDLYEDYFPAILEYSNVDSSIRSCLSQMLDVDPAKRSSFTAIRALLQEGKENIYKSKPLAL